MYLFNLLLEVLAESKIQSPVQELSSWETGYMFTSMSVPDNMKQPPLINGTGLIWWVFVDFLKNKKILQLLENKYFPGHCN